MRNGTGVLVGRRDELDALRGALVGLEAEGQGVVQIAGEPGIGKTRLIAEVCAEAERLRYMVFNGRSAEFEADEAFGVFVDALDDYLGSLDVRELERPGLELDELARLFPALAVKVERTTTTTEADERHRAHRAVRGLLDVLGGRRPVVLALDDLHWADAASAELLSYLVRRPVRGRLLMVLAFRPAQLPSQLAAAIDASTSSTRVLRLELDPLTRDEARRLVGSVGEELYELSGGNPFFLQELARGDACGRGRGSANGDVARPGVDPCRCAGGDLRAAGVAVVAGAGLYPGRGRGRRSVRGGAGGGGGRTAGRRGVRGP